MMTQPQSKKLLVSQRHPRRKYISTRYRSSKIKPMKSSACQLHSLQYISRPLSVVDIALQLPSRFIRFFKRRVHYLGYRLTQISRATKKPVEEQKNTIILSLQTGDLVRIKSKEEIRTTLDAWNRLSGCTFLEEMWAFCGTNQRVMKRLERFLDERDYRVKRSSGIILLEGVICQGSVDFGKCDRSCFFFWREEWLEKIS
jgi:hypothetical protein